MELVKGDAQLLWNQFSELREPQVESFYPFFKSILAFFYSIHFHTILFSLPLALFSYLLIFLFSFLPFSIHLSFFNRCFLSQDTLLGNMLQPANLSNILYDHKSGSTQIWNSIIAKSNKKFTKVVGVGRDLSPHYYTYLGDYNRWKEEKAWIFMILIMFSSGVTNDLVTR